MSVLYSHGKKQMLLDWFLGCFILLRCIRPTTPKNSGLSHVQLASDENMEVDLQDDRKRRREGVLAMALDSSGKVLVTTDDSPFGLDKDSFSVFDLAKSAEQARQQL